MESKKTEKSVAVDCSFCGEGIEGPEDMLAKSQKHMCYECFVTRQPTAEEIEDVHVDIPAEKMPDVTASHLADTMVEELFPDLWSEQKEELKEKSKKDLAEEMFGAGVYLGVKAFMESMQQAEDDDAEHKETRN